jgi:hypothetical protein
MTQATIANSEIDTAAAQSTSAALRRVASPLAAAGTGDASLARA